MIDGKSFPASFLFLTILFDASFSLGIVVVTAQLTSTTTMQPCTREEMMLLHPNLSIMDEDDDPMIPVVTATTMTTTTTTTTRGHRSSKTTRTTPRSFGRVVARVGAGMLLLLLMVEGAVVMPEKEDEEGALLWSDPATAAEEGTARTPRRHRRNLVTKKNPQQVPPTEYDVAFVDVDVAVVDVAVVDVAFDRCDASHVVCPSRCEKLYADCFAEVNACQNEPTCYDKYHKIITTCDCDAEYTCYVEILEQGIYTTLQQNLNTCLFQYWEAADPDCWYSGTACFADVDCGNCCNSWFYNPPIAGTCK